MARKKGVLQGPLFCRLKSSFTVLFQEFNLVWTDFFRGVDIVSRGEKNRDRRIGKISILRARNSTGFPGVRVV